MRGAARARGRSVALLHAQHPHRECGPDAREEPMVRRNRIGIALLLVVLAAAPLWADGSLFGTIAGKALDESGGALPGVTVELTSNEKGFQRTATTGNPHAMYS